jgi:uncharacterized protein
MDNLSYYAGGDWFLIMIPIILMVVVQQLLQVIYSKYSRIKNSAGLSGAEAARKILDSNGLSKVGVGEGQGVLSDYYDPTKKHINLSPAVYRERSIASIAIAAHESGHAIQHATGYPLIAARNIILPFAIQAGNLGWVSIFIGLLSTALEPLIYFGIFCLCVIAVFQLLTLPIEINASRRALKLLEEKHFLVDQEVGQARSVLRAAALTYVVGLFTSIIEVIRAILISQSRNNDSQ